MPKEIINTPTAPAAIGTYSQAVKVDNTVYISGQIPLEVESMALISDDITAQIHQVFKNLNAICVAANGSLADIVKLNIFLTDLNCFAKINAVMAEYFDQPYPARAAIEVSALPKGAAVEMDAIMIIES